METENLKPQTGGLKLMTVFIVVLLLHVAVIGGISAYHLLKGNTGDALAHNPPPVETVSTTETKDPLLEGAPSEVTSPITQPPAPLDESFVNSANQSPAEHMIDPAPVSASSQPVAVNSPQTSSSVSTEYVVVKGDTLSKIARLHGMKVAELRTRNGLQSDNLKIGQKLQVNGASTSTTMVAAPTSSPAPRVTKVNTSTLVSKTYTVSKGDTLVKIARQFNTTPAAIMAANKINDPTKLKIGAALIIPSSTQRNQLSEQKDGPQPFKPVKPDHGDLVMVKP